MSKKCYFDLLMESFYSLEGELQDYSKTVPSRELSLSITNLQQSRLWLQEATNKGLFIKRED